MRPALTHIALHVPDLDACIDFYERFCGMRVFHERAGKGSRIVWMAEPGRERELIFVIMPGGVDRALAANDYSHLGFAMASREDVDAVAALARQAGCLIWEPPRRALPGRLLLWPARSGGQLRRVQLRPAPWTGRGRYPVALNDKATRRWLCADAKNE